MPECRLTATLNVDPLSLPLLEPDMLPITRAGVHFAKQYRAEEQHRIATGDSSRQATGSVSSGRRFLPHLSARLRRRRIARHAL
jgi:hypothetical protein